MKPWISALVVVATLAGASLRSAPACRAADLRTVALSTLAVTDPDREFSYVTAPVINNSGQVAFRAFYPEPTEYQLGYSLWSEGTGTLQLVARTGVAPTADSNPLEFYLTEPQINDSGQVAFRGYTSFIPGTQLRNEGIWRTDGDHLRALAVTGDVAATALSGFNYRHQTFSALRLNAGGDVAFDGGFFTGQLFSLIFWQGYGGLWIAGDDGRNVVVTGLPGVNNLQIDATHYAAPEEQAPSRLQFNDEGEMAFSTWLQGPSVPAGSERMIWRMGPSGFQRIVREGEPTTPESAVVFRSVGGTVLNNEGRVAFWAATADPAREYETSQIGVWADDGAGPYPVIRTDDIAPDTGGATFTGMGYPQIDDAGDVAFWAASGGDITGIWRVGGSGSRMVAREGQSAPGTHAVFGDFAGLDPILNSVGQVAFRARLGGPGLTWQNSFGLWALDLSGELQLIARTGDPLEVAEGDVRTISQLEFVADGFNDRGQLAFRAEFTDGTSGVFVSNAAAVPEPGNLRLVLFAAGSLAVFWRAQRGVVR